MRSTKYPNLSELVGKTADMRVHTMVVRVRILEVNRHRGKVQLLITPESGSGTMNVSIRRIVGAQQLAGKTHENKS